MTTYAAWPKSPWYIYDYVNSDEGVVVVIMHADYSESAPEKLSPQELVAVDTVWLREHFPGVSDDDVSACELALAKIQRTQPEPVVVPEPVVAPTPAAIAVDDLSPPDW